MSQKSPSKEYEEQRMEEERLNKLYSDERSEASISKFASELGTDKEFDQLVELEQKVGENDYDQSKIEESKIEKSKDENEIKKLAQNLAEKAILRTTSTSTNSTQAGGKRRKSKKRSKSRGGKRRKSKQTKKRRKKKSL